MNASGLPARIGYTVVSLPLGGAAGFYLSVYLLPKLAVRYPQIDPSIDWQGLFNMAVGVGSAVAFSVGLLALTLPWRRRRKRQGRSWRIAVSGVLVVMASAAFATEVHGLVYDLAFAAWLAYTLAYTFVRYGVTDHVRRSPDGSKREY